VVFNPILGRMTNENIDHTKRRLFQGDEV